MEIADILSDIQKATKRARTATYLEAKREFGDEAYPLMEAFAEAVVEKFEELGEVIGELIEGQVDALSPDVSKQIQTVLALGAALATDVLEFAPGLEAEKRDRLVAGATIFLQAAHSLSAVVAEMTVGEDVEDEEDGEDEEDTEEEVTTAPTPIEATPAKITEESA